MSSGGVSSLNGMQTVIAPAETLLELLVLSDPQIAGWLEPDENELPAPPMPCDEGPAVSST
jgi:hypothetical protein